MSDAPPGPGSGRPEPQPVFIKVDAEGNVTIDGEPVHKGEDIRAAMKRILGADLGDD